ncbi:MAG: TIGR00282 family metallophosphoesterase [Clostridia bacterium]|nr:TIGR00282 family metallophosphoesterase [Clostridia bacterium]
MNILAIGDLVGDAGLKKLGQEIKKIKEENEIDFTIVNGENVADGMGIIKKQFDEIINIGTDVVTMGNHTWGKKDIFTFIDDPKIIRPANYPSGVCGKGYNIYTCKDKKIAVINLIGRTDMNVLTENPFQIAKKILKSVKEKGADIIIVDFHAEATAEKIAMSYHLDGEATIVYGTHTHVQTADEKITEKGTGYITDIGMTGPKESVIGMNIEASLKRFVTTLPEKYRVATGETMLNGCVFQIDDTTNKVTSIKRIQM